MTNTWEKNRAGMKKRSALGKWACNFRVLRKDLQKLTYEQRPKGH